ncbi:MAG TPA: hypothetical protein VMV69_04185 [Pirellulales bacterium]|nr:hypothetical protein [Pirellulales bacterium]
MRQDRRGLNAQRQNVQQDKRAIRNDLSTNNPSKLQRDVSKLKSAEKTLGRDRRQLDSAKHDVRHDERDRRHDRRDLREDRGRSGPNSTKGAAVATAPTRAVPATGGSTN